MAFERQGLHPCRRRRAKLEKEGGLRVGQMVAEKPN